MTLESVELRESLAERLRHRSDPDRLPDSMWLGISGGRAQSSSETKRTLADRYAAFVFWLTIDLLVALALCCLYLYSDSGETFQNFSYPPEISDFGNLIEQIDSKLHEPTDINYKSVLEQIGSQQESIGKLLPLDQFEYLRFSIEPSTSCAAQWRLNGASGKKVIRIAVMVRSGANNHMEREAIRRSWFDESSNDRFQFKTVFIVGACDERNPVPKSLLTRWHNKWTPDQCRAQLERESAKNGDLLQTTAVDTYYNLTAKMVAELRWQCTKCQADFFLSLDDDFAFEVGNFLHFLTQQALGHRSDQSHSGLQFNSSRDDMFVALKQLSQRHLYAGSERRDNGPVRSRFSKWYISYEEYRYDKYPAWIAGGAVMLSFKSARHFYLASYFVPAFKYDDVYMGIIARKLGVEPMGEPKFMCDNHEYLSSGGNTVPRTNCIGVHEVRPADLIRIWSQRRTNSQTSSASEKKNTTSDTETEMLNV